MDWMPIESAPRDGSNILLLVDGEVGIYGWVSLRRSEGWYNDLMNECAAPVMPADQPTHWMALPPPTTGETT